MNHDLSWLSDLRLREIKLLLNSVDWKYKHLQWDEITCDYSSFLKKLYNHFTGDYITVNVSIEKLIVINNERMAAVMEPSLPNIICLLINENTKCHCINDINLIMKQNGISYLQVYHPYDGWVLFNVPYRCYWYIIDAILRNDIVEFEIHRKPKPEPIKTFKVEYYPVPFHHNILTIIYHKYIEYLKNIVWQEFHIKNPSSVHEKTLEEISIDLQYEYNEYIRTCGIADDIVNFFKRAKIFNQLIEYRYLKLPYGLYNKLHFWIRERYVNGEVYVILEKHDNDTLQWFLKQTDTFKYFDDWYIKLCRNEYKPKKRERIKTFGYYDLSNKGQWNNSYQVIQTGDEAIDRQLRSLVSTFIDNTD